MLLDRAPEVLLGTPYHGAIDMWSFACVCMEMYLGLPLFPGVSQHNQLTRIVEMFGSPPDTVISLGKNSSKYFYKVHGGYHSENSVSVNHNTGSQLQSGLNERSSGRHQQHTYRIKTAEEYAKDTGTEVPVLKKYLRYNKLAEVVMKCPLPNKARMTPEQRQEEYLRRQCFLDFLSGLFQLDPCERWTAKQAAAHPFITNAPFNAPYVPIIDPLAADRKLAFSMQRRYLNSQRELAFAESSVAGLKGHDVSERTIPIPQQQSLSAWSHQSHLSLAMPGTTPTTADYTSTANTITSNSNSNYSNYSNYSNTTSSGSWAAVSSGSFGQHNAYPSQSLHTQQQQQQQQQQKQLHPVEPLHMDERPMLKRGQPVLPLRPGDRDEMEATQQRASGQRPVYSPHWRQQSSSSTSWRQRGSAGPLVIPDYPSAASNVAATEALEFDAGSFEAVRRQQHQLQLQQHHNDPANTKISSSFDPRRYHMSGSLSSSTYLRELPSARVAGEVSWLAASGSALASASASASHGVVGISSSNNFAVTSTNSADTLDYITGSGYSTESAARSLFGGSMQEGFMMMSDFGQALLRPEMDEQRLMQSRLQQQQHQQHQQQSYHHGLILSPASMSSGTGRYIPMSPAFSPSSSMGFNTGLGIASGGQRALPASSLLRNSVYNYASSASSAGPEQLPLASSFHDGSFMARSSQPATQSIAQIAPNSLFNTSSSLLGLATALAGEPLRRSYSADAVPAGHTTAAPSKVTDLNPSVSAPHMGTLALERNVSGGTVDSYSDDITSEPAGAGGQALWDPFFQDLNRTPSPAAVASEGYRSQRMGSSERGSLTDINEYL